ncbi:hypothetical protein ONZ51_g9302 [Trametes cubensis]|uniref:Uncharacterized protein n=1 Tax=Trametes cubensis TaxID=1111947 RepID=A0AAD7X9X3_9APHY|nr:hypothetical protein ONZ51_g9302 [Trametes cubensis]
MLWTGLADTAVELLAAKSVNDLLEVIYDALEVHRTIANRGHSLNLDVGMPNVLMNPLTSLHSEQSEQDILRDCPPLIDEVVAGGDARSVNYHFDLEHTLDLTAGAYANGVEVQLYRRPGAPFNTARAVCGSRVHCNPSTLYWLRQMPLLDGDAKSLYIKMHGEERYNKYNDHLGFIHGGKPPKGQDLCELYEKAEAMPFYDRWEYGAESIFWSMLGALLRVTPVGFEEMPTDTSANNLNKTWRILCDFVLPEEDTCEDSRNTLLSVVYQKRLIKSFPSVMKPVALLLVDIIFHVLPPYPLMDELPTHHDHLHGAIQRLILQYLVNNRDNPIVLEPRKLRAGTFPSAPAVNRGSLSHSQHSASQPSPGSRGKKRTLALEGDPAIGPATKQPRCSTLLPTDRYR